MLESAVESYLRRQAKARGCICMKFISPGNDGVPDRILIHPSFRTTVFVETKAPGEKPRKLQIEVHKKLRRHGAEVHVIDTKEKVDRFFEKKHLEKIKGKKEEKA